MVPIGEEPVEWLEHPGQVEQGQVDVAEALVRLLKVDVEGHTDELGQARVDGEGQVLRPVVAASPVATL